ncbi:MAG: CopD family protein [Taibaiella sp.]|nr:CopD family protein [Taibaiella sp.]
MFLYIKALHIIFVVTWFSGMFYIVRLFIYQTEANDKAEPEKAILTRQFAIMIKRLWLGITWPSAILTLIIGPLVWYQKYHSFQLERWLAIKLCFVVALYGYHLSLHYIYRQLNSGSYKYTSNQLRIWNEVATIFLIAIVMLAVVQQGISLLYGLGGLVLFAVALMGAIKIYKAIRMNINK